MGGAAFDVPHPIRGLVARRLLVLHPQWPIGGQLVFIGFGPFSNADGCDPAGCLRLIHPNPPPGVVAASYRCQRCDPAIVGEVFCPGDDVPIVPCQRQDAAGNPTEVSQCCGNFPLDQKRPPCQDVPLYCVPDPDHPPAWAEYDVCPLPEKICFDDGRLRAGVSSHMPMRSGFKDARIGIWRLP